MNVAEYSEADSLQSLIRLLQEVEGTRVTLIGDVMLDRYHHGYSNNLNSTAPVPVLRVTNSEESPGAAAHIARGLFSLGLNVDFYSSVGDDEEGATIIETLSGEGIETEGIIPVSNRKTLTKIDPGPYELARKARASAATNMHVLRIMHMFSFLLRIC